MATKSIKTMVELAEDYGDKLVPYKLGDTIEGEILDMSPRKVLVDVMGLAVGIIPESEYSFDTMEFKKGDKISVYVLSMENDDGYVILSHKRANREALWETLKAKSEAGEIMSVKVSGANRGGLLVEAGGIDGFIPVSQLSSDHYPKVQNGSGGEIARRLQELIGQTLKVKVLSVDKNTNKLYKLVNPGLNQTAWKTGILIFIDTPLDKVIEDLNSYYKATFVIEEPRLKNCKLNTKIDNFSLDDVLQMLEIAFNIKIRKDNNTYYLTGKGC